MSNRSEKMSKLPAPPQKKNNDKRGEGAHRQGWRHAIEGGGTILIPHTGNGVARNNKKCPRKLATQSWYKFCDLLSVTCVDSPVPHTFVRWGDTVPQLPCSPGMSRDLFT